MNTKLFRHLATPSLSLLALALALAGISPAMAGDDRERAPQLRHARPHFHILPPQPRPFQRIYAEWSARWWQWATSLPADAHPLTDTADISAGQSGPVWFLGGTFGEGAVVRSGTVPAGKALFFPLLNLMYFAESPADTEEVMREVVNLIMDHVVNVTLEIDGKPVRHLARYRTDSPLFEIGPHPANAVFGLTEGATTTAVSDGLYVLLLPLAPGAHTIRFTGEVFVPEEVLGFEYAFTQDVTYHLTVAPRGR